MEEQRDDSGPQRDRLPWKAAAAVFLACLAAYFLLFRWDGELRTSRGPWELEFSSHPDGSPRVRIDQASLGISNVVLRVEGVRTGLEPRTVSFDGPGVRIPFGQVVFFDTTYLPGTLTLDLHGHLVELMGRCLVVNYREIAWEPGAEIVLRPGETVCWVLGFSAGGDQPPRVVVGQELLGIQGVELSFEGRSASPVRTEVRFDRDEAAMPFGKVVSWERWPPPGTLELELLGHSLVLSREELRIDGGSLAWTSGTSHRIPPPATRSSP